MSATGNDRIVILWNREQMGHGIPFQTVFHSFLIMQSLLFGILLFWYVSLSALDSLVPMRQ